ncbi:MAG: TIGR02677 family protein [Acidimicrobiales bacterium]
MADTNTSTNTDDARRLFRYITVEEWRDYRAIMTVFAGTFFSEFVVEDVASRLEEQGIKIELNLLAERLESLRRWGNLTVSSAVGNPASIADYYRRRNRYLITRAGQEVHTVVEGVLARIDEVRDVSTSRLRALAEALHALAAVDPASADPHRLADLVRAVFDPHEAFTTEIAQFFVAINQWQNRYDLDPEEFAFFAEVLVGYVAERLDEIERLTRPIAATLALLEPNTGLIATRAAGGLAARVDQAGLGGSVSVSRQPGTSPADWAHLAAWFVRRGTIPSRIEQLTAQAVAAIRTLTMNLTRLSRVGVAASSRRADLLRLAAFFNDAESDAALSRLAVAAFGLHPPIHWGVLASDSEDPVATTTPWAEAPPALVPVSLRQRGDTANRGRASPIPDRTAALRLLEQRRAHQQADALDIDRELLAAFPLDAHVLSSAAMARAQDLIASALRQIGVQHNERTIVEGRLRCAIVRTPGRHTTLCSEHGRLELADLTVTITASGNDRPLADERPVMSDAS